AAKEVLAAATTDAAISAGETVETSNVAAIMQAFAAAVVAVLVVGVAFFALADSSRRRPARALPSEEADPPLVAAGAASVAPRGRALADTVMPAAYRPASLEAMESALESEVTARSEPTPASAAAPPTSARPATPTPVSARSTTPAGSTNGSSAGKSAAVTGPAVVSVSSPASPATGGSAKQASTTSSSSTGSPSTTGAPAPDGDKVSAAALTEDVTVEPVSTGSDVAVSGTEERKSGGGAGERPRRARRPEAQSMFARPAETTSAVTATPEEPESEVAPVNADARQRRSAANRRRLGN
ncbi:MAG: hypothetical protein ACKV2O_15125, partial [Acidimicrobiales bacterium]